MIKEVTITNGQKTTTIPLVAYNREKEGVFNGWRVVNGEQVQEKIAAPKQPQSKDYSGFNRAQLLSELKALKEEGANIEFHQTMNKASLIQILEENA